MQWSGRFGASHSVVAGLDAREVRGASDELAYVQSRPSFLVGSGGRERTIGLFAEEAKPGHGFIYLRNE